MKKAAEKGTAKASSSAEQVITVRLDDEAMQLLRQIRDGIAAVIDGKSVATPDKKAGTSRKRLTKKDLRALKAAKEAT